MSMKQHQVKFILHILSILTVQVALQANKYLISTDKAQYNLKAQ